MPRMNIFGELEYTDEELKEIERKKKEEEKAAAEAKAAEEKRKAQEKEAKRLLTEKRKTVLKKLEELRDANPEDLDMDDETMSLIEDGIEGINAIETMLELDVIWNPLEAKYNAMQNLKQRKEKEKEEAKQPKYKYPFLMYFGHEYRDVTGVFEEGKEYTGKQLTKTLVEHGFKDFKYAQEVQWEYFEDENCLYPKFKLGNRG